MEKEKFVSRLKELKINKKEFSNLCNISYSTVNAWGCLANGKVIPVPGWVEPFLNYYEKAEKLDYIAKEICAKIK